jgi:hypothetical protein
MAPLYQFWRRAVAARDALVTNTFVGAADELAKAHQELSTSALKDAIFHAAKVSRACCRS